MSEAWRNRIVGHGEENPEQLLANPRNFRIHPKPQQDALLGVIRQVGIVDEVLVNQATGFVVNGHLRVAMAISERQPTIPVKYVDLTEEEEALILATFDPISAMAATDKEQLDALLREVSTEDAAVQAMLSELAAKEGLYTDKANGDDIEDHIDEAEELREKWGCQVGQLWEIESQSVQGKAHRLLCGDSTKVEDVQKLMGQQRAYLLLSDPPYNLGISYGASVNDSLPEDQYETFSRQWFGLWRAVSDRQIVTPGCHNLTRWVRYFQPYHIAPWTKTNSLTHGLVSRFWCWEPITFFGEPDEWGWEGILFFGQGWQRKRANDVFNYPIGSQKEVAGHPCPKPLVMWEDLIQHYAKPGQLIADAFLGSGTTMVAAERKGCLCFGAELEPKYVAVSIERMAEMGLESRLIDD